MLEHEVAQVVVDVAFQIHKQLGRGILESVYQAVMTHELRKRGLRVESEEPIPAAWDGIRMEVGFRSDLIVEHGVIVELKSVEVVAAVHKKQLLSYLQVESRRNGLLINFNAESIQDGSSPSR